MRLITLAMAGLVATTGVRLQSMTEQSQSGQFADSEEIVEALGTVSKLEPILRAKTISIPIRVLAIFVLALTSVAQGDTHTLGAHPPGAKFTSRASSAPALVADSSVAGGKPRSVRVVIKHLNVDKLKALALVFVVLLSRGSDDRAISHANYGEDKPTGGLTSSKLNPFPRGTPSSIKVDSRLQAQLAEGRPYEFVQIRGNTGLGRVVLDIDAPPEIVWQQLLDFKSYPKKVSTISKCDVYKRERGWMTERIFVRFESPVLPGYKFVSHCEHTYEPRKNSITWTLDFDHKNDLEDVQGHWHVDPVPGHLGKSRIFYELQTVVPTWIPKFVIDHLTRTAITDATSWVKKASEKALA